MNKEVNIESVDDAIICWTRAAHTLRTDVFNAAKQAGIDKFVPTAPVPSQELQEALKAGLPRMFGRAVNEPFQVRATNTERSFEAVRCVKGADENDYKFLFSCEVNEKGTQVTVLKMNHATHASDNGVNIFKADIEADLNKVMQHRMQYLTPTQITKVAVAGLLTWRSQSMNDRGNVYLLPAKHVDDFSKFVEALPAHSTQFYIIPIAKGINKHIGKFGAQVMDQVEREINEAFDEILTECTLDPSGDIHDPSNRKEVGIRTKNHRIRRVEELTNKWIEHGNTYGATNSKIAQRIVDMKAWTEMMPVLQKSL